MSEHEERPLIVTVCHDQIDRTVRMLSCLLSSIATGERFDLVLIDDGSHDRTLGQLHAYRDRFAALGRGYVEVRSHGRCLGESQSINEALAQRRAGQPFVRLDSQVEVLSRGWISWCESFVSDRPVYGIVAPYVQRLYRGPGIERFSRESFQDATIEVVRPVAHACAWHSGDLMDRLGFLDILARDHLSGFTGQLTSQRSWHAGFATCVSHGWRVNMLDRDDQLDAIEERQRACRLRRLTALCEMRSAFWSKVDGVYCNQAGQPSAPLGERPIL